VSTAPTLSTTAFTDGPADGRPLLLLGPSLGTSTEALWRSCAERLREDFHVVGWDLPGHGASAPATSFDIPALASALLAVADDAAGVGVGTGVGVGWNTVSPPGAATSVTP